MTKSPLEVAKSALEEHLKGPQEVLATVDEILSMIEEDKRLETILEGIEAFKVIIKALVTEFPKHGYEDWLPSSGRYPEGKHWKEAVSILESYWSNHTGMRE